MGKLTELIVPVHARTFSLQASSQSSTVSRMLTILSRSSNVGPSDLWRVSQGPTRQLPASQAEQSPPMPFQMRPYAKFIPLSHRQRHRRGNCEVNGIKFHTLGPSRRSRLLDK